MKVEDYFAEGKEPPVFGRLLATIDDETLFPLEMANVMERPDKIVHHSDGKGYHIEKAVFRGPTSDEMFAFRERCKAAMRDIFNFALFCWVQHIDEKFVELAKSVEVGTALIEENEFVLYEGYSNFSDAITAVANEPALEEDDAVPFLYFMRGTFMASREEWFWERQKGPGGPEKPWQHM